MFVKNLIKNRIPSETIFYHYFRSVQIHYLQSLYYDSLCFNECYITGYKIYIKLYYYSFMIDVLIRKHYIMLKSLILIQKKIPIIIFSADQKVFIVANLFLRMKATFFNIMKFIESIINQGRFITSTKLDYCIYP